MRRSKALTTLLSIALFGALAFAPSGCSSDSSSSPELGLTPSGYDPYPPAMVSGLEVARATEDGFKLTWDASTDNDLVGYRVYVYDPSPYRDTAYRSPHSNEVIDASCTYYTYREDLGEGFHYFKIVAVDADGNESLATAPLEFSWENVGGNDEYSPRDGANSFSDDNPPSSTPPAPWEGKEEINDEDDGSQTQ
jgi:hypothetical protein